MGLKSGPREPKDPHWDDEVTGVHDQLGVYRKLEKLDGLMQKTARHVSEIPEIKERVNSTSEKVVELKTKLEGLDTRVGGVERRMDRGHDCYQVDVIAKLSDNGKKSAADHQEEVVEGVRAAGKIASIENDVTEIKRSKKWIVGVVVGLLFPIAGSIGSAIWLAASLSARVETQEELQRQRLEQVTKTITVSSQQHTKAIQVLDRQLEKAAADNPVDIKVQDWYKRLPDTERRRLDVLISKTSRRE